MFDKYAKYDNIRTLNMKIALICAIFFILTLTGAISHTISLAEDDNAGEEAHSFISDYINTIDNFNFTEPLEKLADIVAGRPADSTAAEPTPDELKILTKADIDRIGAQAAYEEFAGMRFGKYFSVGQRVEIYQTAKPIDAYILDAKAIRYLGQGGRIRGWDTPAHFRSQITPLFTRAYGTQLTLDDPKDHSAQIRYTLDYRETYRTDYPKWPHLLWYHWTQNEIMLINGTQIDPIGWYLTLNLGYRYSNIIQKDIGAPVPTNSGTENRHTYLFNFAIAPNDQFEWFSQAEYFKSLRPKSTFPYSPDHFYFREELRFKSKDHRTSLIPFYSYSKDLYWPLKNTFSKHETGVKIGHDFTEKWSASSLFQYVASFRDEPDNTAPDYGGPRPIRDMAAWAGVENRVSYNFINKFSLQAGLDFSAGTNMSDFDNVGTLLGIEYYKPGVLRANFGWQTHYYYNIDDTLNTIGFKVYIFM